MPHEEGHGTSHTPATRSDTNSELMYQCDGQRPICKFCSKAGAECVFDAHPGESRARCFAEKTKSSRFALRTRNGCLQRYFKDRRIRERGSAKPYPQEHVRTVYSNSYTLLRSSTLTDKTRVAQGTSMLPRESPAGASQRIPLLLPVA